jgi:hypothetical protein
VGSAGVAEGEDDVEGQLEDKLELAHRNEEDIVGDEIVVVQAGRSKDDVGKDTQNPSPRNVYRPAPAGAYQQTQFHATLRVGEESRSPKHSSYVASPMPLPIPVSSCPCRWFPARTPMPATVSG